MQSFHIKENDAPQRVDRFLRRYLSCASLGMIYKFLRNKTITLNGAKTTPESILQIGDELKLFLSDETIATLRQEVKPSATPKERTRSIQITDHIIYEDTDILVINKPPYINVHPGDHKTTEISLIELVSDYLPKSQSETFRPALAHRLDRDTSGVIIIAKTRTALISLTHQFREKEMHKEYIAVVSGTPAETRYTVQANILRKENAKREAKISLDPSGDFAKTVFERCATGLGIAESPVACMCALPSTGRMHQIRIHLQSIGHPIIGDATYGNRVANNLYKHRLEIDRQLLHARKLTITHPVSAQKMTFIAPLPDDIQRILGNTVLPI